MDQTSPTIWGLNEAIWTVDLSSVVQPKLRFAYAEWNDESHPLPSSFIGSSNGDGVAVSEDGTVGRRCTPLRGGPRGIGTR